MSVYLELFDRLVVSDLLYNYEIWGHESGKIVEGLQLKFLKYILGVRRSALTFIVYGKTGAFPIEILAKCRMISFWLKLISSKFSKLSHKMYYVLFSLYSDNIYKCPWLTTIHKILNTCGLCNIWFNKRKYSCTIMNGLF